MIGPNISRGNFIKKMAAAGSILGLGNFCPIGCTVGSIERIIQPPIALQLYTLRELTEKNFTETLKTIAKMGYSAIESGDYGGFSARELRKIIDDLGLQWAGSHEALEKMESNISEVIEFNLELGNKNIVCPYMPKVWQDKGSDGYKEFGEKLNELGSVINDAGIQLCYHNHAFEFKKINGKDLFDYMIEVTDPALVKLEVDVYWLQYGDVDPIAFLQRHADRCHLLHMKDMYDDDKRSFAPVGVGIIDMKSIVKVSREMNIDWYIVEQDSTTLPVLEAVELSLKNMRKLLKS